MPSKARKARSSGTWGDSRSPSPCASKLKQTPQKECPVGAETTPDITNLHAGHDTALRSSSNVTEPFRFAPRASRLADRAQARGAQRAVWIAGQIPRELHRARPTECVSPPSGCHATPQPLRPASARPLPCWLWPLAPLRGCAESQAHSARRRQDPRSQSPFEC
eukprot:scaffold258408_cov31-Tisochrysis_lutea.AAC.3